MTVGVYLINIYVCVITNARVYVFRLFKESKWERMYESKCFYSTNEVNILVMCSETITTMNKSCL